MWYFQGEHFTDVISEFDSFVYLIERLNVSENTTSPIFYVGKKTFFNKSKFKGKRIIVESDWWDYYGSSDWLNEDIEKFGRHNFKRTILHLCRTRGDAGYLEAKEQIVRNVLHVTEKGWKPYYNKNVLGRYQIEPEHYVISSSIKNYCNWDVLSYSGNKLWVTDSKTNRLVSKKIARELVEQNNWVVGRAEKIVDTFENLSEHQEKTIQTSPKNKVMITKNEKSKWIFEHELNQWLKNEWSTNVHCDLFTVNNGVELKSFTDEKLKNDFIEQNSGWFDGSVNKSSFIDKNMTFAKDIRSDEKVRVTKQELKTNKFLTSVRTKKVKVKKKNRIVFRGYVELFLIDNPELKKTQVKKALRSDGKINDELSIYFL